MDFLPLANALHTDGWIRCPGFLSPVETAELAAHLRARHAAGDLHPARIGHRATEQRNADIRGDAIVWLDDQQPECVRRVEHRLEALKQTLNRELMLGLFEFEGHFAVYPEGSAYRRHLDQFRDADTRRLTVLVYLNDPDWSDDDGGHLRLYLDNSAEQPFIDIKPEGGTLLLFLSARFYHEVRPTRRQRLSLTGWYRVRE